MNITAENTNVHSRTCLEMEFSDSIAENFVSFCDIVRNLGISSIIIYIDDVDLKQSKLLVEFCQQISEKNIKCTLAYPWALHENDKIISIKNISRRLRVCAPWELKALFTCNRLHSDDDIELYYDETICKDWNIAEAMELCHQKHINCVFGCSDSFISISQEKLSVICGNTKKTPFPGGHNCLRFVNSLYLTKDGTIFPCKGMKCLPIGNIFSESIEEQIANSTVLEFYNNYAKKIKHPCKTCPEFSQCAGCRGRAHKFSSDFLSADPCCHRNISFVNEIARLPIKDPENYLPHKQPMLLVSELHAIYDNSCEAFSIVQSNNPFIRKDGTLDSAAFIEIGAQSMAFLDAFLHPEAKLQGMLVEINKFSCNNIAVYPGAKLRIICKKIYEMPPWSIGSFEVLYEDNTSIATGEVKVCQLPKS